MVRWNGSCFRRLDNAVSKARGDIILVLSVCRVRDLLSVRFAVYAGRSIESSSEEERDIHRIIVDRA